MSKKQEIIVYYSGCFGAVIPFVLWALFYIFILVRFYLTGEVTQEKTTNGIALVIILILITEIRIIGNIESDQLLEGVGWKKGDLVKKLAFKAFYRQLLLGLGSPIIFFVKVFGYFFGKIRELFTFLAVILNSEVGED